MLARLDGVSIERIQLADAKRLFGDTVPRNFVTGVVNGYTSNYCAITDCLVLFELLELQGTYFLRYCDKRTSAMVRWTYNSRYCFFMFLIERSLFSFSEDTRRLEQYLNWLVDL